MAGHPIRRAREGRPPAPGAHGKWRDAWPGNDLALKHGAHSERRLAPVAEELTAKLLELAREPGSSVAYLGSPEYLPAIGAWASVEAECTLYRRWFSERGLFDDDGQPRPGVTNWDRAESRAAKARQRLGLDPLSRARLGRDVSGAVVDLAMLMAERGDDDD